MHAYHHHARTAAVVACPECHEPAQVLQRVTLESTDGPLEHVKVRCDAGHWFMLPADRVVVYAALDGERAA